MTTHPRRWRALDEFDRAIVSALQEDGRVSNKELAARVHLSPSSCLERVRRLRKEGVLVSTHTEVHPEAVGLHLQALIGVRLEKHSREAVDAFKAHAWAQPEVQAIYHVGGDHDFLLHVVARDTHHLRDMTMDAFTTRKEVAQIETRIIFEHKIKHHLPLEEADPG